MKKKDCNIAIIYNSDKTVIVCGVCVCPGLSLSRARLSLWVCLSVCLWLSLPLSLSLARLPPTPSLARTPTNSHSISHSLPLTHEQAHLGKEARERMERRFKVCMNVCIYIYACKCGCVYVCNRHIYMHICIPCVHHTHGTAIQGVCIYYVGNCVGLYPHHTEFCAHTYTQLDLCMHIYTRRRARARTHTHTQTHDA